MDAKRWRKREREITVLNLGYMRRAPMRGESMLWKGNVATIDMEGGWRYTNMSDEWIFGAFSDEIG
jgi:hypothetical protein